MTARNIKLRRYTNDPRPCVVVTSVNGKSELDIYRQDDGDVTLTLLKGQQQEDFNVSREECRFIEQFLQEPEQ